MFNPRGTAPDPGSGVPEARAEESRLLAQGVPGGRTPAEASTLGKMAATVRPEQPPTYWPEDGKTMDQGAPGFAR